MAVSAHEQEKKTGIGSEELILRSGRGHGGGVMEEGGGRERWFGGWEVKGPACAWGASVRSPLNQCYFFIPPPLPLSFSFLDGAHITMVRVPGFLTQFEPRFHSERDGRREGSRQASPPAWPCTRCTLLVYVSMCTPRKAWWEDRSATIKGRVCLGFNLRFFDFPNFYFLFPRFSCGLPDLLYTSLRWSLKFVLHNTSCFPWYLFRVEINCVLGCVLIWVLIPFVRSLGNKCL